MSAAALAGAPAGILLCDRWEPSALDEGEPRGARSVGACGEGAGGQAAPLVTGGGRR